MKSSKFMIFLMIVLFSSINFAAETSYHFAPAMGIHNGQTSFRSDFPAFGVSGGSELIFPLDFATYGFDAGVNFLKEGQRFLSVDLRIRKSISDPGGEFTDRDWYFVRPGLETNFSYTESMVEGSFSDIEIEFQYHRKLTETLEFGFLIGFGHSKVSQLAKGLVGAIFVIDTITAQLEFYGFTSKKDALSYEITHTRPYIGLIPTITLAPSTKLILKGAWSPIVKFDDRDDHLLRFLQLNQMGMVGGYLPVLS